MKRLFPMLLWLVSSLFLGADDILFSPPEWSLEENGSSLFYSEGIELAAENRSSGTVALRFVSSRPEMEVEPPSLSLPPGGEGIIRVTYDGVIPPEGERIFTLLVLSEGGTAPSRYMIYSPRDYQTGPAEREVRENYDRKLVYYYSPACRDCRDFLEKEIPRLEKRLGIRIDLEALNIYEARNMARLQNLLDERGIRSDALPVLEAGDSVLAGDDMIRESLEAALAGNDPLPDGGGASPLGRGMPLWILVGGAGLLDGVNPCAFSTLIFLLAYLGLRKGNRREILIVGLFFTLSVFITYTAVGAGALIFLRQSMSYGWISPFLRWGGAMLLAVLGILSLRDWSRVRAGKASEMSLQLSEKMKRAVHKSVRGGVRSSLPVLGAWAMGFLVTVYELGCTGQIYLPALYLMIRQGDGRGVPLLLLYNLAFILPLLLVFLLAYRGMTSDRLGRWFRKRLGTVKLMTALFFWLAAALVLLL